MNWVENLRRRYRVPVDPLRTERRVELVLVVLIALFLLQLLISGLMLSLDPLPAAKAPSGEALRVRETAQRLALAQEGSEAIRARPLFWQGRRPAPTDAEKAAARQDKAAPRIKDLKLLGVFGSGDSAGIIAVVKGKQRRVMVGEKVNGWDLVEVNANEVKFRSGGVTDTRFLQIKVAAAGDTAAAAPAPGVKSGAAKQGPRKKKAQKNDAQKNSNRPVPGQIEPRQLLPAGRGGN